MMVIHVAILKPNPVLVGYMALVCGVKSNRVLARLQV